MMKEFSVIPAAPGWFLVGVRSEGVANVMPIGGWVVTVTFDGSTRDEPIITTTPLVGMSAWGDAESLEAPPAHDFEYQVFAPGENPLNWAKQWEEVYGRKITTWDVSNWWPSKAPVFATADETLWSEAVLPADDVEPLEE